jgi:hypothetical protein
LHVVPVFYFFILDAARVSDLAYGGGTKFMRPTLSKVSAGQYKRRKTVAGTLSESDFKKILDYPWSVFAFNLSEPLPLCLLNSRTLSPEPWTPAFP